MRLDLYLKLLPDGLPVPATPTHTVMPGLLENATDVATETHLHKERLYLSQR